MMKINIRLIISIALLMYSIHVAFAQNSIGNEYYEKAYTETLIRQDLGQMKNRKMLSKEIMQMIFIKKHSIRHIE